MKEVLSKYLQTCCDTWMSMKILNSFGQKLFISLDGMTVNIPNKQKILLKSKLWHCNYNNSN